MEVQLNGLLEQLRSQKTELPQSDHSIIDWVINSIQIRLREKEILMSEVEQQLIDMRNDYLEDLKGCSEPDEVNEIFQKNLSCLVNKCATLASGQLEPETNRRVSEYKKDLESFFGTASNNHNNSYIRIIEATKIYCKNLIAYFQDVIDKSEEIQEQKQAEYMIEHYNIAIQTLPY